MSAFGKDSRGVDVYDLYDNMEPKSGGLLDTRMGTTDNYLDCSTCGLDATHCVGHFGHIDLMEPIYHLGFIHNINNDKITIVDGTPYSWFQKSDISFEIGWSVTQIEAVSYGIPVIRIVPENLFPE